MENIRSCRAGKEWGNIAKCYRQLSFKMFRSFETEWLTGVQSLKQQISHEGLLCPALILLFDFNDLFGQVTFTFTDHDRVVSVYTEVSDNVFLSQFIIQVHQRNNPCFDKHQEREPQGNPLFSGSFQEKEKQF